MARGDFPAATTPTTANHVLTYDQQKIVTSRIVRTDGASVQGSGYLWTTGELQAVRDQQATIDAQIKAELAKAVPDKAKIKALSDQRPDVPRTIAGLSDADIAEWRRLAAKLEDVFLVEAGAQTA